MVLALSENARAAPAGDGPGEWQRCSGADLLQKPQPQQGPTA
jgi:hypothetical protein